MRVFDLMDPSPPTIEVPSEREGLVQKFAALRVRGLSVVKAGTMKLAGVVLRAKLLENDANENQVAFLMDPNPYTLYMQAPLREAAQALVRTELPMIPVVTGSNDLVGVVNTEACLGSLSENQGRVATHLRRRLIPIHRLTPAAVAVRILRMTHASALPVLDDRSKLCGIVTDGDLLANAFELRAEATVRAPTAPVERFMVSPVVTVHTMSTVGEAAKIMLERGWHQLPVVDDNGDLVDLVTDHDLLGALL